MTGGLCVINCDAAVARGVDCVEQIEKLGWHRFLFDILPEFSQAQ